jgi:hypothetical protein
MLRVAPNPISDGRHPSAVDSRAASGAGALAVALEPADHLTAVVPLFVNSPNTKWVQVVVGLGSWIVFVVDLVVQRRIVSDYLGRTRGRIYLVIVLITFPYYLIPGVSGGAAILLLARLTRVARVLLATAGLRRFGARLGKVALIAGGGGDAGFAGRLPGRTRDEQGVRHRW